MRRLSMLLLIGLCLSAPADPPVTGESSKQLDFEGDTVEGLNRQPLDSLSQISESDSSKERAHLYQKKKHFREENKQTLRELSGTY